MKKFSVLTLVSLLFLSGCTRRQGGSTSHVEALETPVITEASDGPVRVEGTSYVDPFNTSMSANLYYSDGQYSEAQRKAISDQYVTDIEKYHAYSDNHYDYTFQNNNGEYEKIANVKTLNESYGSEKPVVVSDYLFDLLKTAYTFTLNSDGRFNIFLGQLTSLYEDKLSEVKSMDSSTKTTLDCILEDATHLLFDDFSTEEKNSISSIVATLPQTKEELTGLLTFEESNHSVTFHTFYKNGKAVEGLKLSLGGVAKGFATERVASDLKASYPDISMLLNSGTSSVKTVGIRPDSKDWAIRYNNPSYYEYQDYLSNPYNPAEVLLRISGGFNISTSGYYENCFFSLGEDKKSFLRRNHILNPLTGYSETFFDQVSVFLDNTGLADMYTTCIMNCTSLEEAENVFASLNEIYGEKDAGLILCYKSKKGDPSTFYSYSMDQLDNLNDAGYPSVRLSDNSIYQGDYSTFNLNTKYEMVSEMKHDYQENYYFSSVLYPSAFLLTDSSQVSKPVISVLEKLE